MPYFLQDHHIRGPNTSKSIESVATPDESQAICPNMFVNWMKQTCEQTAGTWLVHVALLRFKHHTHGHHTTRRCERQASQCSCFLGPKHVLRNGDDEGTQVFTQNQLLSRGQVTYAHPTRMKKRNCMENVVSCAENWSATPVELGNETWLEVTGYPKCPFTFTIRDVKKTTSCVKVHRDLEVLLFAHHILWHPSHRPNWRLQIQSKSRYRVERHLKVSFDLRNYCCSLQWTNFTLLVYWQIMQLLHFKWFHFGRQKSKRKTRRTTTTTTTTTTPAATTTTTTPAAVSSCQQFFSAVFNHQFSAKLSNISKTLTGPADKMPKIVTKAARQCVLGVYAPEVSPIMAYPGPHELIIWYAYPTEMICIYSMT